MELLIAFVVVIAIVVWWRRSLDKARRLELRRFVQSEDLEDYGFDMWVVDFVEMAMAYTRTVHDPPSKTVHLFKLRRRSSGRWQGKQTQESCDVAIKRLKKEIKKRQSDTDPLSTELRDRDKGELASLLAGAKWQDLDGELVGPLESQYQRFVAHYPATGND